MESTCDKFIYILTVRKRKTYDIFHLESVVVLPSVSKYRKHNAMANERVKV